MPLQMPQCYELEIRKFKHSNLHLLLSSWIENFETSHPFNLFTCGEAGRSSRGRFIYLSFFFLSSFFLLNLL